MSRKKNEKLIRGETTPTDVRISKNKGESYLKYYSHTFKTIEI
ncbi:MAG: hypothetical protein ACTSQE_01635 [Candidatus Heimdallarchaeaceae archaeon]